MRWGRSVAYLGGKDIGINERRASMNKVRMRKDFIDMG